MMAGDSVGCAEAVAVGGTAVGAVGQDDGGYNRAMRKTEIVGDWRW